MTDRVILGAVAYDPKVVTIWEGFRAWFAEHELDFDFVLYSNYERQVEAHLQGQVQGGVRRRGQIQFRRSGRRGEQLAEIPSSGTAAMHFELRQGFDSVDPVPYLTE